MKFHKLSFSDISNFRDLALSDGQNKIIIRSLCNGLYAVILRMLPEGEEVGLSRLGDPTNLHTFQNLEECIQIAIDLSQSGHIFFDVLE